MNGICCRNGYLCATDANVLVHVPARQVLGDELAQALEGKIIPPRIYKQLYTECARVKKKLPFGAIVKIIDNSIFVLGPGNVWISAEFYEGKFPDWEFVWNDAVAAEGENFDVFGINAKLLDVAAKAMGVKYGVQLYVKAVNRGILLAPNSEDLYGEIRGMIMPTLINPHGKVTHEQIQQYMPDMPAKNEQDTNPNPPTA